MFDPLSSTDLLEKMEKIISELKHTDFTFVAQEVISKWDRNKYSDSINKASKLGIKEYKKRGFVKILLLKLYIYLLK